MARMLTINRTTLPIAEWARRSGIPEGTIRSRLQSGWSPERAVFTEVRRRTRQRA
jgi:hypothetical protein